MAGFQYSEKGAEGFAAHLAAEDLQVGEFWKDSREHRWPDSEFDSEWM